MIILPAIDLKDGTVVRLYKGDFDTVHQVADDPVATAQAFYDAGARYIHMVDLDGAKDGTRKNSEIVRAVAKVGLRVELGGGIRSLADLETVFDMGVYRAVIGSAAVSHPELVSQAVETYGPDRIAVGIDTQNGKVKIAGWLEDSGLDYLDFAKQMRSIGVKKIIFTDIETDGTLEGPAFSRLEALGQAVDCDIIASGGVACNQDIVRLHAMGLYGAIIGKAYYAGTIDLAQAVREAGAQC
jgi:phosphoribosylformimino-5-aminoimidazole carboxamide ribotide isomerase